MWVMHHELIEGIEMQCLWRKEVLDPAVAIMIWFLEKGPFLALLQNILFFPVKSPKKKYSHTSFKNFYTYYVTRVYILASRALHSSNRIELNTLWPRFHQIQYPTRLRKNIFMNITANQRFDLLFAADYVCYICKLLQHAKESL